MDNLEDVLNGSDAVEAAAPDVLVESPEPVAETATQPRDPAGRFAPKGDEPPAIEPEAAPPAAETEPAPWKGQIEERRKRQDAERERDELRQQVQALTQGRQTAQTAPQPQAGPLEAPVPLVFEDEYAQSIFEMAVAHVRQEFTPQLHRQATTTQIEMQRLILGQSTPDFAATEQAFFDMARDNPVLLQEANRQPNPVKWAYDYAKKAQEVRTIGSLDIEAIKRAAVEEHLAKTAPAVPAAPQTIPTSLADAQSARSTATAPTAPPSLDQILGRR